MTPRAGRAEAQHHSGRGSLIAPISGAIDPSTGLQPTVPCITPLTVCGCPYRGKETPVRRDRALRACWSVVDRSAITARFDHVLSGADGIAIAEIPLETLFRAPLPRFSVAMPIASPQVGDHAKGIRLPNPRTTHPSHCAIGKLNLSSRASRHGLQTRTPTVQRPSSPAAFIR